MSGVSQDWIFVFVFFGAFAGVTIAEIYWLSGKLLVPIKKAMTLVFVSNFLTITLGFLVTFVLFALLFAVAWDQNTTMPGGEVGAWAIFIAGVGFPVLLMAAIRRLLIVGMRIDLISKPLTYSILSSLIFFAAVVGIPAIYLLLP
ncbi:MAG: hypothetical protein ABIR33_07715 [Pyrinomonadaceae bacterium]